MNSNKIKNNNTAKTNKLEQFPCRLHQVRNKGSHYVWDLHKPDLLPSSLGFYQAMTA